MLDQAESLRKLVLANKNDKDKNVKIFTITSGKGGVGKSNFVVNLAISLQMEGKKVLIFDADIGMGNDDVLMGLYPKYNIIDVIKNKVSIEDALVEGPYGVKLLAGGSGLNNIEDLAEEERRRFINELDCLEGYDYIFIDTGAGVNRSVLAFVSSSNEVIFILTPEPTALTDGYSLIKALKHFEITTTTNIVVNRVIEKGEGKKTFQKFNMATEKFLGISTNYLGCVYEDRKVTMAVRSQKPAVIQYPGSIVSESIKNISKSILGTKDNIKGLGAKELMSRLFGVFS